jgi:UDP-N-acetylglucosamine 2-epimerase
MKSIQRDQSLELLLVVTGTHLSHDFGLTIKEIERDKFPVTEKIDILLNSDSPSGVSKTMGIAAISFSSFFDRFKPDLIIRIIITSNHRVSPPSL